ncbi:hypothetical protein IE4803_PD00455 (plasmid) [Rhizobium etli bv. phaseoli str. IE4803]|nr:hypothetical protein IE4803_PD00455 [Rhizobium etli bv. phaseoli str. IE4803]
MQVTRLPAAMMAEVRISEQWLAKLVGVTPMRVSHALRAIVQDDDRLAIGRREASCSSPIPLFPNSTVLLHILQISSRQALQIRSELSSCQTTEALVGREILNREARPHRGAACRAAFFPPSRGAMQASKKIGGRRKSPSSRSA